MNPSTTFAVATAPKRNSRHWKAGTVTWAEILGWAETPDDKKEAGNYFLGTLKPDTIVMHPGAKEPCGPKLHRRKDFVVTRSAVTLDVDTPEPGFADKVELLLPYAALMHTTFSSTPEEPRYRLIIPVDRPMLPDEYVAVAFSLMADLGTASFDPGTTQPERYMFKPATSSPEVYAHTVLDGPALLVDDVLADFEEDLSAKPVPKPGRNKRDPFGIEGVVGAFNKAYEDFDLLIETFDLPYEHVSDDRWQLLNSRAVAGMGPVAGAPGLYYSHHANDPAFGITCSSFDLVRLHLFGELDEGAKPETPINRMPSNIAMSEHVKDDLRVRAQLAEVPFDDLPPLDADNHLPPLDDDDLSDLEDSNIWKVHLNLNRQGRPNDVIGNWDLWTHHDPAFRALFFNELTQSIEINADLPWRTIDHGGEVFTTVDRKNLLAYLEREYNGFKATRAGVDDAVETTAARTRRNPVREYLESLSWDGKRRVENSLPGVVPTAFTRLVARKCLVAAVARIFDPGCKWDHTLVIYGSEGLGKTFWIEKLARGYMSPLGPLNNKDTLLTMQRSWIMLADEGQSLRKGDADAQKEFLTRTEDVFRMPYDRETLAHKRHCVIWSTTNDETFLRRQEGNRRFLIVHSEEKVDFDVLTDAYVDQLWAEAVHLYREGEKLFLDPTESAAAAAERERFVEEDALGGVIENFLDTLVPEDWEEWTPEKRRAWVEARSNGFEVEGTEPIMKVCSMQIWVEALGQRPGDHRRVELLDITNAIKRLPGWAALPGRHRLNGYGPQTVFGRVETPHDLLRDLI